MVAVTSAGIRQSSRQAVSAAVIGNVLEWYDFAVYGFMAAIIGKNFFPSGDEVSQLLAAFAVYGVGFLARPVGGVEAQGVEQAVEMMCRSRAALYGEAGGLVEHQQLGIFRDNLEELFHGHATCTVILVLFGIIFGYCFAKREIFAIQ